MPPQTVNELFMNKYSTDEQQMWGLKYFDTSATTSETKQQNILTQSQQSRQLSLQNQKSVRGHPLRTSTKMLVFTPSHPLICIWHNLACPADVYSSVILNLYYLTNSMQIKPAAAVNSYLAAVIKA